MITAGYIIQFHEQAIGTENENGTKIEVVYPEELRKFFPTA